MVETFFPLDLNDKKSGKVKKKSILKIKTCLNTFISFKNIPSLQDNVTIDIEPESVSSTTDSNTDTVPGPSGPQGEKEISFMMHI